MASASRKSKIGGAFAQGLDPEPSTAFDADDGARMSMGRQAANSKGNGQLTSAEDTEAGEEEGVTASEYNKWLHLEANWELAEETRHAHMEGSQVRKSRDERHRERGMERQAASIEQMKSAKGKLEAHRESNQELGKEVRQNVQGWKQAASSQQQRWLEHGKSLKEQIRTMERERAERDALLSMKKALSVQVKMEVLQLAQDGKQQKEEVLASNRSQAGRIRTETAAEVTDDAKKFMFEQRRQAALATQRKVQEWDAERRANKLRFREDAARKQDKLRKGESTARNSRKQLQEQRQAQAEMLREHKKSVQASMRSQQEEHAALVKQVINGSMSEKFASSAESRRMLQHPHYQEMTAVLTDVTSQISKEIASSPRRRPPSAGKAATPALRSPSATAALTRK